MRAGAPPLAALKVPVGGGGAAHAGLQYVAVHRKAQRAAALALFKAGGLKDVG